MGCRSCFSVLFLSLLLLAGAAGWYYWRVAFPVEYRSEIRAAITENWGEEQLGEYEPLILAIILTESRFNPSAKSGAGAVGLMQVMPATARATARDLGIADFQDEQLLEPAINIRLGTRHLKYLLDLYGHNRQLALAGYNGGGSMAEALRQQKPIARETADYLLRVQARESAYKVRLRWQEQLDQKTR